MTTMTDEELRELIEDARASGVFELTVEEIFAKALKRAGLSADRNSPPPE